MRISPTLIPLISIIFMCISCNSKTPSPLTKGAQTWKGITPGKTTLVEVTSILGEYFEDASDADTIFYLYQIPDGVTYIGIAFKDDIVTYIILSGSDAKINNLSQVRKQLGDEEAFRFTKFEQGFQAYVYSSNGLAVIAEQETGDIASVQLFVPMTVDEYLNSWGSTLLTEDPFTE